MVNNDNEVRGNLTVRGNTELKGTVTLAAPEAWRYTEGDGYTVYDVNFDTTELSMEPLRNIAILKTSPNDYSRITFYTLPEASSLPDTTETLTFTLADGTTKTVTVYTKE